MSKSYGLIGISIVQPNNHQHRKFLMRIARRVMLDRGLLPDFSHQVLSELEKIKAPASFSGESVRDLRGLLWSSIDNYDSLDLDQLTVAIPGNNRQIRVLVAIADVDGLVRKATAIDNHAENNTTSIYTPAGIFPMLPEKLSTELTSLAFDQDRLSIVVDMEIEIDGTVISSEIYRAWVHNHAKLAYNSVASWLEEETAAPEEIVRVNGLDENLRLQDQVAQKMKRIRHFHGALTLKTIEANPVFDGEQITGFIAEEKNRAKEIIEDFMIAANGVVADYLSAQRMPSIRRVVHTPKRWSRIVDLAAEYGYSLPHTPESKPLDEFLMEQKTADPLRFPDLSLTVIKLLGSGEYIAELPGEDVGGHFGLAVDDYTHSTAPNRRFTDLITQRLIKAAIDSNQSPYCRDELIDLAKHCTIQEDIVHKVERHIGKSAAALLLQERIGEQFDAIVTGAASKGTWVRLLSIPVEGKMIKGHKGVDVGDHIHVRLVSTDIEKGYIDFVKVT